jgi:hypothetical protein
MLCVSLPQPDEDFFVCQWSQCLDTGAPLLLLAGKQGLVKVIDTITESFIVVSWVGTRLLCGFLG